MNRSIFLAPRILLWLAVAGLVLAGGWQSHAQELTDHHAHEHAAAHGDPQPHAHFGTDRATPGADAGLVVHCGADILPLSGAPEDPAPALKGGNWCGPVSHPSTIHPGRDPPPPRILA